MIALSLRNISFFILCILFGFFSTPTPDEISIIEILIGLLLVIFISPINVINSLFFFSSKLKKGNWFALVIFLLIINIFFVGFFNGVFFRDNDPYDLIRDFIPILYMLIPFFLFANIYSSTEKERNDLKILVSLGLLIISMGYIFQFMSGENFNIESIGVSLILGDSPDNIMQDPSITFALMLSFGVMVLCLEQKKILLAIICLMPQILIISCLFASVLRAPIGLFAILSIFLITNLLIQKKRFISLLFICILGPLIININLDLFEGVFKLLIDKNTAVGLSGRDEEFMTLISVIKDPFDLIFGFGLGAALLDIHSYQEVRYTHNFFLYILMKFGIIGLFIFIIIIYKSINVFIINILYSNVMSRNFIIMISTIAPLTISLFFEPMYKSLSFGLIILLITIIGVDNAKRISN